MLRARLGCAFFAVLAACGGTTSEVPADPSRDAKSSPADTSPQPPSQPDGPAPSAPNGGNCTYANVIGTATITSIEEPGALDDACSNDGVVARFSFTPDDPAAAPVPATWQKVDEGNRTITQGNKFATRGCLTELGLDVGSTFRVERLVEATGTCTPVIYMPQVDFDACKTPCDP